MRAPGQPFAFLLLFIRSSYHLNGPSHPLTGIDLRSGCGGRSSQQDAAGGLRAQPHSLLRHRLPVHPVLVPQFPSFQERKMELTAELLQGCVTRTCAQRTEWDLSPYSGTLCSSLP